MDNAQATDILKIIDPRLAVWIAWLVLISMIAVDWVKAIKAFPVWAPPAMAFGANVVMAVTLALAIGVSMSGQVAAQCVILALVATVGAIGASALKGKAVPRDERTPTLASVTLEALHEHAPTADEIAERVFAKIQAKVEAEKREAPVHLPSRYTGTAHDVPTFDTLPRA